MARLLCVLVLSGSIYAINDPHDTFTAHPPASRPMETDISLLAPHLGLRGLHW